MPGHGYVAAGMLLILPASFLALYIVMHPRFRKGMPLKDAVMSWNCVACAFLLPVTLGFVGRHKRQQGFDHARLSRIEQENAALEAAARWVNDYGFWLMQLHMFWIVASFFIWNRSGAAIDIGPANAPSPSKAKRLGGDLSYRISPRSSYRKLV